ncbi:hypothetical protein AXG93_4010s1140 [Marchantia polymorpha subsp. ruderalis]|uniref:Uncharacterized protein n=1 Tax=Marchantia polymorpha subsp. ruderalis TaxID=1480154 RepID=A0A176VI82_MARPO|nr:hypothetical protein AXG93_4010s1140 [Marchantia polymorpha subsp. ruderalis]
MQMGLLFVLTSTGCPASSASLTRTVMLSIRLMAERASELVVRAAMSGEEKKGGQEGRPWAAGGLTRRRLGFDLIQVVEDLNFVILMQRKFNYLQSIPGVFVPHPSPHPSIKRNNSLDGSPPSEAGCWAGNTNNAKDPASMIGLFTRSNSDPFRLTAHSKQLGSGVLGIKRPNEDVPLTLGTGRDFPFLSPAINFSGSPRFNCGQLNRAPECPSPPKALNTGLSGNHSLLPSMSSLHNLLSKLPSVTASENGSPLSSSPSVLSNLSLSNQLQHSQSFSRQPLSPSSSSDSPGLVGSLHSHGGMMGDQDPSPRSSPPHQSCANGSNGMADSAAGGGGGAGGGAGSRHDNGRSVSETSSSQRQPHQQQSSWHNSEYAEQQHHQHQHHHHAQQQQQQQQQANALSDLGLHDELLENSETYNSFLSEIIS